MSTAFAFSHVVETRRPRQLLHQKIPVRRRHRPFDDWIPKGSATHSSPAGCCRRIVISIEIECRVRLPFILTPLKKERTPGSIRAANRQRSKVEPFGPETLLLRIFFTDCCIDGSRWTRGGACASYRSSLDRRSFLLFLFIDPCSIEAVSLEPLPSLLQSSSLRSERIQLAHDGGRQCKEGNPW